MNPELISLILLVLLITSLAVACIHPRSRHTAKCAEDDPAVKMHQADGEPCAVESHSQDNNPLYKPSVVSVTLPDKKLTSKEVLRAANANRTAAAKLRADRTAQLMQNGMKPELACVQSGYASVDSMRKALSRWGFTLHGQPKGERRGEATPKDWPGLPAREASE